MKKFIILSALLSISLYAYKATSQNYIQGNGLPAPAFFMPESELMPRYEKLPAIRPIGQNTNNYQPQTSQPVHKSKPARYIAVDGRFIPVYDEETPENAELIASQDTSVDIDVDTEAEIEPVIPTNVPVSNESFEPVTLQIQPEIEFVDIEPEPLDNEPVLPSSKNIKQKVNAPAFVAYDPEQAPYRNRYNQYLADLQTFEKTRTLPFNQELENTLSKLNSNQDILLFDETVEPII